LVLIQCRYALFAVVQVYSAQNQLDLDLFGNLQGQLPVPADPFRFSPPLIIDEYPPINGTYRPLREPMSCLKASTSKSKKTNGWPVVIENDPLTARPSISKSKEA